MTLNQVKWSDDLQKKLQEAKVVLIDFFADRCGPCQMLSPVLEELAEENKDKDAKIIKLDTEENADLAWEYWITSIPAVFVFKNWELVEKMVWLQEKSVYQDKINSLL